MRIGIIGLGEIALKAYLPVVGRKPHEIHLFTRNAKNLHQIGEDYRFSHRHNDLDALIGAGIQAAFVHSSTDSHYMIVKKLLENGIHVYVDKPVTYHYDTTQELVSIAHQKKLTLMTGFNRRYAPTYKRLRDLKDINMVVMQKNRESLPGEVRPFVFDDFIHVIDTLLFLLPGNVERITVNEKKEGALLYHLVVQLHANNGVIAIGIMNRDSGTTEERLEVFTPRQKRVVVNVNDSYTYQQKHETKEGSNDWESTLHKRGFEQIIEAFLQMVAQGHSSNASDDAGLLTHEICENIVRQLTGDEVG